MDEAKKGSYEVGFGKPPRTTQFRPGQSGNPRGRPRGAKNFSTALEEELRTRISVTEDGKRKKISKRQVIAKHLVNKAAAGDLKAIPLLLNETRVPEALRRRRAGGCFRHAGRPASDRQHSQPDPAVEPSAHERRGAAAAGG